MILQFQNRDVRFHLGMHHDLAVFLQMSYFLEEFDDVVGHLMTLEGIPSRVMLNRVIEDWPHSGCPWVNGPWQDRYVILSHLRD